MTAERAVQLAPELRDAHEVAREARAAFSAAAEGAGDRTLADPIRKGFAVPSALRR